jgi:radical SAM superfamily enzyme YgiQ (UPF0313 family)
MKNTSRRRVLLVSTNMEKAPYPVPPLGLCLAAASIEPSFEVKLYDGMFEGASGLQEAIADFAPHYIGIGIRNIDDVVMEDCRYFVDNIEADFIRPIHQSSNVPMILGGSGFNLFPKELMQKFEADYGIVGEAELAFPALLQALEEDKSPIGIPGVMVSSTLEATPFVQSTGELRTPFSMIDKFVDFLPYGARSSLPVQTKRGCAHSCLYCSYPTIEGRKYRTRLAKEVAREIEEASKRLPGVTFELVDSTFNDPPGHAEQICEAIIERKLDVRLRTMGVNPRGVTTELVRLMRRAGFAQIDCTPDSASPAMLESLRKNFSLEDLKSTAKILADEKMPTMWFFVFGGPGESEKTVAESFEFIDKYINEMDLVHMTAGLRIYPGAGLEETALKQGLIEKDESLLRPRFYVEPGLGARQLRGLLEQAANKRPNCVPAWESTPPPQMMAKAMKMRSEQRLDEPMFRTLLRIRYQEI